MIPENGWLIVIQDALVMAETRGPLGKLLASVRTSAQTTTTGSLRYRKRGTSKSHDTRLFKFTILHIQKSSSFEQHLWLEVRTCPIQLDRSPGKCVPNIHKISSCRDLKRHVP